MKYLSTIIFTLLFCYSGSSQLVQDLKSPEDTILYEKLYLHIDREMYSPGDDVWFKAYLVSGINHQPISGFKNVYVELISEDGRVIDKLLTLSINGVCHNDFHLPNNLPAGQYTIRGYTKYLLNFGEESLFHQKIAVSRATELPTPAEETNKRMPIEVSFLPEGGNIVLNAASYVAFKVINESGKGINITGKIVDETGQLIAPFECRYKGMGTVIFMPQEGKSYYALINGYPDFEYRFEEALPDGVALHYQENGSILQFILSRNYKASNNRKLILTATHKGHELFMEEVRMNGFMHPVNIFKGLFPPGISKITLYDEQYNILAERLVFVRNPDETALLINPNRQQYQPREKIELEFESQLLAGADSLVTGVSVAVVNEAFFSEGGKAQTMESYLLLDSELKGPLETPASLFTDEENLSADEKLNLVMLVNGWRRYYWEDLIKYFDKPLPGYNDIGLTIEGEVKTLWGGKPVSGGIVEMGPFSRDFLILKDTTDEAGRFRFNRVFLRDSAVIMMNAFNKKGRRNVEIFHQPTALFDTVIPDRDINRATWNIDIHEYHSRSIFNRHLAEREFELEHSSTLIGEVEVIEKYRSGAIISGNYGFPDREFMITDAHREEYSDIIKYLEFEVPGVYVYGNDEVRIAMQDLPPIYFVDDYPDGIEMVRHLPMKVIQKVELFTPKLNYKNSGGVISILTTNGFGKFSNEFVRIIHNRITPRFKGFRQAREFYAPGYPLTVEDIPEKPDFRPTLSWQPYVQFKKNKANIEFHASDMPGKYVVIAEGITAKGRIISSSTVMQIAEEK